LVAVASTIFALTKLEEVKKATAQTFAATAKAQINTDPFDAVVNGLAAMGRLASDPVESIELSATLAKAVSQNWQIGAIPTGQGGVSSLIELKNGELISGGSDGSLRHWGESKTVIAMACRQLREHPALLDPQTTEETAASATCRNRGYLKQGLPHASRHPAD
jgi:hypothetical protein